MELDKKLIGNRIKQERINIRLTQEELAQKLGLNNKSSISQYEKGDAIPSDDIKFQMAKIFDCSIDYLLGKSDVRNPKQETSINEYLLSIGFDIKNYNPPDEKQKEQIKALIEVVLKDNKKE